MTQQEVIKLDALSLPYATAKFPRRRKRDPSKKAFMRIYLQIPFAGAQYQSVYLWSKENSRTFQG